MEYGKLVALLHDGASFEDFYRFAEGHIRNIERFDELSAKSLQQLYDEYANGDAKIMHVRVRDRSRIGRLVRTARVLLTAEMQKYWLRETKRVYPNGSVVRKDMRLDLMASHNPAGIRRQKHSLSESMRNNETPAQAAVRGLKEECGITEVSVQDFHASISSLISAVASYGVHESSAYHDVLSYEILHWMEHDLPKLPWPVGEERMVVDNGVEVYHEWFENDTPKLALA